MLNDPLFHIDSEPEAVNTDSHDTEKEPFDVIAEKLSAGAVEDQLAAVNHRVTGDPALPDTDGPGGSNAKGQKYDKSLQKIDADEPQKAAGKAGFAHGNYLLSL